MEKMESEAAVTKHENKNNSDAMWETLFTTLTDGVHKCNSNMETILDMIKNDLTYDDPGLFPSRLLVEQEERDTVKACNYWLLNQLLQIASLEEYREIRQRNSELQQTILSACFLKQYWFFREIVAKYLETLEHLNGFKINSNLQLKAFHMSLNHLSRFNSPCTFIAVEVKDMAMKRTLTETCLHVLSQVVCLIDDRSDKILREHCAEVVLETLNNGSLDEKTYSLMFFAKYLKLVSDVSRNLDPLVVEVLTVVEMSLERSNRWLESQLFRPKSLQQFKMALVDFFAKLKDALFSHSFVECKTKLIICSIRIVKHTLAIKKNGENENQALFEQIRMFLMVLMKSGCSSTTDGYEDIFTLVKQLPDMLELLESPITDEAIQLTKEKDIVVLAECSYFWKNAMNILDDKYNVSNDVQKLSIRQQIVRLSVNVSHNFLAYMQTSKLHNKQLQIYGNELPKFFHDMFEDLKTVNFTTEIIAYMMDICFDFLHLSDFSLLEETLQSQICSSLFLPFSQELKLNNISLPAEILVQFKKTVLSEEDLRVLKSRTLDQLCSLNFEHIPKSLASLLKKAVWEIITNIVASSNIELNQTLLKCYSSLLLSYKFRATKLFSEILQKTLFVHELQALAVKNIKIHFCLEAGNVKLYQIKGETTVLRRKIRCLQCKPSTDENDIFGTQQSPSQINVATNGHQGAVLIALPSNKNDQIPLSEDELEQLFRFEDHGARVEMVKLLAVMLKHNELAINDRIMRAWSELISCGIVEVYIAFADVFTPLSETIQSAKLDNSERDKIIQICLDKLLQAVRRSVEKSDYNHQSVVMNMVLRFATSSIIGEQQLVHCLRMMFFFLMLRESEVTRESTLVVEEMCDKHGVTPRDMFNWYRHDIVKLIMAMCATNYCCYGISLLKSLVHVSKTFQFASGPVEFITKYYKIVLAMLLPWCVKRPKCIALLQELSELIRTDITVLLSKSFSTIYPYLFINETPVITNQCIDYIITNTGNTLVHLLQSDIKKTVSEILIFYHLNAECVLHAFRSLLAKDDGEEITTAKMAEYIAGRFLGVITFFEASLIDVDNEKALKRETLLSLGEIIRLLGGHHVTPFRFKIIALLKTTMAIEKPNLKDICVGVWRIFICTVDVQQLGPLLSTIFVSLGPYIEQFPEDINYIFNYLVVQNNSLLSQHIPDLFFLDQTNVNDEIKKVVSAQTKNDRVRDQFLMRFTELGKHVTHENLAVRIYGLKYLKQLFMENRNKLNDLMIGQLTFNPMVEELLNNLIKSCSDSDINYRLSASECMGELGALAPSYLPPNYAPQDSFALGIHSDAFASMALAELCRAYQSQKDTKFVDSFSLAIQDILVERGVSPNDGRKLDVWHAIPERLRPLMEPLLTSSYTGLTRTSTLECHPIFGSPKAQSYQEWAFLWGSQMIEKMEKSKTQSLLKSFQPSIRCDMKTMAMVLPYILLHAIQGSTEDNQKRIVEELQFLFNAIVNNNPEMDSPEQQIGYIRGLRSMQFVAKERKLQCSDGAETTDISYECAKLGFTLLDFLEKWKRQWRKVYQLDSSKTDFHYVDTFLGQFDREMLANINFKCNEFARSLIYLEEFIGDDSDRLQQNLGMLARIYTHLNDPDSVEGVVGMKTSEPTLSEQILLHNATGQLNQAAACYECMLQEGDVAAIDIHNMVECYLRLDQPHTALLLSESLLNKYYDQNVHSLLQEIKTEPLYRLGRFDELEELLESPGLQESDSWGVICGSLMVSYKKNLHDLFMEKLKQARLAVLKCLRNADLKLNAYEKGYEQVLKLHMISEFEKCENILDSVRSSGELHRCPSDVKQLIADFESRLDLLQPNAATVEPIISLHRVLLNETKVLINGLSDTESEGVNVTEINETIDEHIGKLWIKSTELASRAKMFDQAHLYILHAENYKPKELFIKKAKLLWERRKMSNAFQVLDRGLVDILQKAKVDQVKKLSPEDRTIYAEGKLMIAIYNAEASNVSASVNQRCFKDAVVAYPESEKSMVHLAQYLDKLYVNFSTTDQDTAKGWELLQEIMTYYGKSMMFGSTYIYQSMPRVLSIWLDCTSRGINNDSHHKICANMNKLALKFSEALSPYFFFTAFSQLISRVAHPSIEVYQVLKAIIVKLILHYPQQTLWMMLSVYKSSYANRVKRCHEIFNDKKLEKTSVQKLITDFNAMAEQFIELTNKNLGNIKDMKFKVSAVVKSLPKLFENSNFSDIMMPIQKCMQLVLDRNSSTFSPYPMDLVYIYGIREEAVILPSLQKPRKISLIGHDGRDYVMMMKPKDDLRKDFRLMEFNAVVKQYLHQDPDAKHRRLNIRTYAVLPLNEECGIVEWVENLSTFRNIICTYYKQRGEGLTAKELRNYNYKRHDSLQIKKEAFLNVLLPRHPPVFSEWFRDRFSNPHNWFQARSSYIRTTAVISIVGYILGLGDRHGENILFDAKNGDTVHVDFNCLFNKGETFEIPELVPFRLTHNMVKAMGPLGIEGPYRRCCEITLRVLQNQTPTLMSVLKPFVYDPLVSWSKITKHDGMTERTDPQAMNNVKHIEERLKGYVRVQGSTSHMPLSVEGQVNHLISEATDLDSLAQMYIGWSGYM
ncbi:serine/threonine-protein kinase ATR-like [Wyeomyia smithii]|uniref:serine/threonine-protein kinase ATR-like n=1 Tax=Wyeomyia smithii TaxID=174621 RepID=UPI002467CACA|nr:serine/threonine-protein kinase ATR-like [Wyeomyia smithii]XP_055529517.1 serine/threonine-protein kinase ATR-like [Wyeomyia smithii]XP_055529518.1 serine/threonine-protein kinase ATR-like [Wyeomyia smithii]